MRVSVKNIKITYCDIISVCLLSHKYEHTPPGYQINCNHYYFSSFPPIYHANYKTLLRYLGLLPLNNLLIYSSRLHIIFFNVNVKMYITMGRHKYKNNNKMLSASTFLSFHVSFVKYEYICQTTTHTSFLLLL